MTLLRGSLVTLVGSFSLFVASTAFADGEACYVDTDCPGTACGDAVCNWTKSAAAPMGRKFFACNPAGSQAAAHDGWCETDADCKCKDQGATCAAPYCTFTKPMTASSGGSSSSGGTAASTGGAPSSGGSPASSGGTSSSGGASASSGAPASNPPADDGGGCSVSGPGRANSGALLGAGWVALGLAVARRRRR